VLKVAVIGGSGFVGSYLIKELIKQYSVINIDKRPSPFFNDITILGDIRNIDQLRKNLNNIDTIIHLAAEHRDDVTPVSLYYDVNVAGTQNILSVMTELGIRRIIFTSSVAVYGLNKPCPNEDFSPDPFNHYGKSKLMAEMNIKKWLSENQENSAVIIRPTVIFGERNRGNVYNLLRQISSGNFMQVGSGRNKKSMCYVGNIVAFIKYSFNILSPGLHLFNYVDKPDLTTKELIIKAQEILNCKIPAYSVPRWLGMLGGYGIDICSIISGKKFAVSAVRIKKFCATTQFDSSRAFNTGFIPPFTLTQGLHNTIMFEFLSNTNDTITFISE
jgi:nucleoside-diphosphate-sugar epimerase